MPRRVRLAITGSLFLALFSGCGLTATETDTLLPPNVQMALPTPLDRGLLYGEPCSPPCWEGITPAVSSGEDVVRVMEDLLADGSIEDYTKESEKYYRAEFALGGTVEIRLDERFVSEIWLAYHGIKSFRVSQVIERLGEPEAFAPYSRFDRAEDSRPCDAWDDGIYRSSPGPGYLLYPSQGVTVAVLIADGYEGCVCAEMCTAMFIYYPPMSLDDALEAGNTTAFNRWDWDREDVVPWHGFGCDY